MMILQKVETMIVEKGPVYSVIPGYIADTLCHRAQLPSRREATRLLFFLFACNSRGTFVCGEESTTMVKVR